MNSSENMIGQMFLIYFLMAFWAVILVLGVWKGYELVFDLITKQCICLRVEAEGGQ